MAKGLNFAEPQLPIRPLRKTSLCNYLKALYCGLERERAERGGRGRDIRRDRSPAERCKAFKVGPVHKDVEVSYSTCVSSMLPCCKAAIVHSHQLAAGISHRDELIPCEITNEPTAPLCTHAHAHIFVGASQPANADATTWSKNAPMVINKQHFG